jgi:mycothiol synthase
MSSSQSNTSRLLSDDGEFGRIMAIGKNQLDDALSRLLMVDGQVEPSHVRQFREYAATNRIPLDHCWGRVDRVGRIRQTVLSIPNPGRTAMMFASRPQNASEIAALGELIDRASMALNDVDVRLAQALLQPEETLDRRAFGEGGFTELAVLSYLERPVPGRGEITPPSWPDRVTIEPYREAFVHDFIEALNLSYEQTLDCPELRGLRETADILDGHRGTGQFEPSLWSLLRIDGSPMGMILLNPSPTQKSIELVYFGLAVAARGTGLGRELLRHGLTLAAGRPEQTINLAVDDRNTPALKLYADADFRRSLRRIALIRPLRGAPAAE